jgi:hypothetical protein
MARAVLRQIVFGVATSGLLMGCVQGGGSGNGGGESVGLLSAPAKSSAGREVEAPEVFQTTDSALWDGRPSLGGIWVASPNATDPERVVMFNPATGKSVTGALFRRERDNPGPPLQISSDAAEALGMLAGQPTEIRVTALRKTEPEPEPQAVAAAEPPAAEAAATAEAAPDAAAAETAALATAALEAADAGAAAGTEAAGAAGTEAAAADAAVDAVTAPEPPKRKTWKERRAEAKARREAEKAAKAAAAAAAEAGTETPVAPADTGAPTADSAGVAAVETAPLDARSAEVTAAADSAAGAAPEPEKKKTRRQIRAEEEAAAAAAAAAAEAAATAPAATGRPIQVASFSKEENAQRAVEALAKIGVSAQPQKSERGGKVVWGVVAMGDGDLLAKIKGAGFADAYFLQ